MDRDLEIAAAASVGGLTRWRAAHVAKVGSPCANCATPLEGPYCHACGQLAEDFERSIGSLLMEAVENLFHADGRLVRTLPLLMFNPARLTRDYLAGHRASQMPPLRLFLVVILVFFFAGSLRGLVIPSHANVEPRASDQTMGVLHGDSNIKEIGAWLKPRLLYASTHRREVSMAIENWLHRVAIIFLPISTLLLTLIFIFRRNVFVFDHAIFSMHSLSFMGLLATAMSLLALAPVGGVRAWLLLAVPTHLFFHMRGVYRTSILGTLFRMALLFISSVICLASLLLAVAIVTLNGMVG